VARAVLWLGAMGPSSCHNCGHPLGAGSRFCAQCGTPVPPPEPVTDPQLSPATGAQSPPAADLSATVVDPKPTAQALPRPAPRGASTMIGYSPSGDALKGLQSAAPASASPPSPAPTTPVMASANAPAVRPSEPPIPSVKRTMMGVAVGDMLGSAKSPAPYPPAQPQPGPPSGPAPQSGLPGMGGGDPRKGTMMGVAIPGIAPLAASAPAPGKQGLQGTMMGVAVPGIAPTHGNHPSSAPPPSLAGGARVVPRKAVEIAPMPPPLLDEPDVGPAPQLVKKGLPLALVAGVVGVVVAIAGVTAFLLLRSPPLIAQPRLDAQGHEQLHLRCDSCQDGTIAELYDARATFKSKEADLALASSLKVGNNPLTIHIDRPNLGRDESVQVVVPVAFRIRADLTDLAAARPTITVRVEAVSGTDVRIDGKPVTLDATGEGAYAIDISSETDGPADETRLIDRLIPYAVTPRSGEAQSGKLTVRVGIAPLHMDAPALHAVVESAAFRIAGRTVKGGSVKVNDTALHMESDGTFAQSFDIGAVGDLPIEVRASAPQLAPRTAHWVVKRVEHLTDEAKAREAVPEATYDAITGDLKAAIGKATIVEGDVIEVRVTSAQTVAVVDDARGCAHAPCLVRVVYGGDTRFKHGDVLRAYGRVNRSVAYGSSTVPEVEADFVLTGHAPKK
jgi:hypothetical protein